MQNLCYYKINLWLFCIIITKVENFLKKFMFTLSCHGRSTAARPVALSLTVYTTIGCRSSRIFPLAGQRYCTCASDVTAVTAASASLRRTPS